MKTHLIYFSPTGTTKAVLESIAAGIGGETEVYDLTPAGKEISADISDGVAVFGVPVYAGRVPLVCAERLKGLSGSVPAVVVGLYGNREYEDALVELRDMVSEAGFRVIAGGAFIGEHSYSSDEKPIAKNRPDSEDRQKAAEFGRLIREKLASGSFDVLHIKGNVPYKERMGLKGVTPKTKDNCGACGTCAAVCPTDVITINDIAVSDPEGCILCCACIKNCPQDARYIDHQGLLERVDQIYKNCSARKEPEIFI